MSSYQNQNNQLKKLHEQRLKRQQQQKPQNQSHQSNQVFKSQENIISKKQIKKQSYSNQQLYPQNIFLNSILSDQRNIKSKPNAIALSSLFQDNPRTFAPSISKNIQSVFMTCYGFMMDVLSTIADSGKPFVLVNDSSENGPGKIQRNYCGYPNMSLVTPPRNNKGYGVFHTKLWLIKFQTFLRVVICTGNQHLQDWITWLNAYWYKDFPLKGMTIADYGQKISEQKHQTKFKSEQMQMKQIKKPAQNTNNNCISLDSSDDEVQVMGTKPNKSKNNKKQQKKQQKPQKPFNYEQDFKQTLNTVLKNMYPQNFNLFKQTGIDLQKYDFSQVDVVLIPSLPGKHKLEQGALRKYGMGKLKSVMKQIGPKIKKGTVTYNSSSLGALDQNFVRQLYFSFLPDAESFSTQNYRLIYPTYKYITQKTTGEAQVLYLKSQNYYKSQIRKQIFYHYEPSQKNNVFGAIPHLKTVVVENLNPQNDEERNNVIFFMGSHNMTKAAWGTYEKSDSQLSFSNSQLGILFLKMNKQKLLNILPYKYPPRKYNDSDTPFLRQ